MVTSNSHKARSSINRATRAREERGRRDDDCAGHRERAREARTAFVSLNKEPGSIKTRSVSFSAPVL